MQTNADKRVRPRFSLKMLIGAMSLVCFAFIAWQLFGIFVLWYVFSPRGEIDREEWPYSLQDACSAIGEDRVTGIRVCHLGGFIDDEFAWRLKVEPDAAKELFELLGVKRADETLPMPEVFSNRRPRWWSLAKGEQRELYLSPLFEIDERGNDGEHYCVLYSRNSNTVRVWHKSNF